MNQVYQVISVEPISDEDDTLVEKVLGTFDTREEAENRITKINQVNQFTIVSSPVVFIVSLPVI